MKFGLKDEILDKICSIFQKFSLIERALIYGSRAKGNFRASSDIDIVLIGKELRLKDLYKIENLIDELLLPYSFDISLYHQIDNIDLINHIDRVGVKLYKKY